jgi:hypothetical protein
LKAKVLKENSNLKAIAVIEPELFPVLWRKPTHCTSRIYTQNIMPNVDEAIQVKYYANLQEVLQKRQYFSCSFFPDLRSFQKLQVFQMMQKVIQP